MNDTQTARQSRRNRAWQYFLEFRQTTRPLHDRDGRRPWPLLVFAVACFLVLLCCRSWGNLTHPALYMEDSAHYFNAYYGGQRDFALILQHPNGYYNIINNLIAWAAATMDVRVQPTVYHLFSLCLGVTVATCMAFTGLIRSKAILLVTPLALGLSGMNHMYYYVSLTFQMYNVVVLLLCLLFFPPPGTRAGMAGLMALAALLVWSGPYSVVAAPAALLILLMYPWGRRSVLASWVILCVAGYSVSLSGGMIQLANILDPDIRKTIVDVLFGQIFLLDLLGPATPFYVGLVCLGIGAALFYLRQDSLYLKTSILLLAIIVLSLAPLFLSKKISLYQAIFPCHTYIAQFFWVFFLLYTLDSFVCLQQQRRTIISFGYALLMVTVVLLDNLKHPDKGFKPPMPHLPGFLETVHQAEQLAPHLDKENQYILLRMPGTPPGHPAPLVRIGSLRWTAQRIDPTTLTLPSGEKLPVN